MTNSSYFVSTVAQGLWTWKQSLVACLGIGVCMRVWLLVCSCPCLSPCWICIRAAGCVSLGGSMAPLCTSPSTLDFPGCWPPLRGQGLLLFLTVALVSGTQRGPSELGPGLNCVQVPTCKSQQQPWGEGGSVLVHSVGGPGQGECWPVLLAAEIIRNTSRFTSTGVYCSVICQLKALETMLGFQQLPHDSICKTTCIGWSSSAVF